MPFFSKSFKSRLNIQAKPGARRLSTLQQKLRSKAVSNVKIDENNENNVGTFSSMSVPKIAIIGSAVKVGVRSRRDHNCSIAIVESSFSRRAVDRDIRKAKSARHSAFRPKNYGTHGSSSRKGGGSFSGVRNASNFKNKKFKSRNQLRRQAALGAGSKSSSAMSRAIPGLGGGLGGSPARSRTANLAFFASRGITTPAFSRLIKSARGIKLAGAKNRRSLLCSHPKVPRKIRPKFDARLGIRAARFLRPVSSVKIFTPPKPSSPSPPPDVPASSVSDELVLASQNALSEVLRESSIESYRPEVVGALDFMPVYDGTGQPTELNQLIDIRYMVRQLKEENIEDTIEGVKTSTNKNWHPTKKWVYNTMKNQFDGRVKTTKRQVDALEIMMRTLERAKSALDIKDNARIIALQAQQDVTGDDAPDELPLLLRDIMINNLDFSREGFDNFANTKVLGQLLVDLRRAIARHSYSLMSDENPARKDDVNSIKYNFDYLEPAHRFRFRPYNLGPRFTPDNYRHFKGFLRSLPHSSDDKIKLLLVALSRELVMSAGIGYLEDKSLGERFGLEKGTRRPSHMLLDPIIGNVGSTILNNTKPDGSIADYLTMQDAQDNTILPFETRSFRDSKNRTFIPGGYLFVDSILRDPKIQAAGLFNTDAYTSFASGFNSVAQDAGECIEALLNLDDENNNLHPASIYQTCLKEFAEAITGISGRGRTLNREQLILIALLKMSVDSPRMGHLLYRYISELRDVIRSMTEREQEDRLAARSAQTAKRAALMSELQSVSAQRQRLVMQSFGSPSMAAQVSSQITQLEGRMSSIMDQVSDLDIQIATGNIEIAKGEADLEGGSSLDFSDQGAPRYSSAISVRAFGGNMSKSRGWSKLMVRSSRSPLSLICKQIAREAIRKSDSASWRDLKGQDYRQFDAESIYSTLRSLASTTRRSENVMTSIIDVTNSLDAKADELAKRDKGKETFTEDGLTKWNKWAGDDVLVVLLEVFKQIVNKFVSVDIVRFVSKHSAGKRLYLRYNSEINLATKDAISDALGIFKAPDRETRVSLSNDREAENVGIMSKIRKDMAAKGELSRGNALGMYDDDDDETAFSDCMEIYEELIDDIHFIRSAIAIVRSIGTRIDTRSKQLEQFFDFTNTSSKTKAIINNMAKEPLGRKLFSTLTPKQLALMQATQVRLLPVHNSRSHLPAKDIITKNELRAMKAVYKENSLRGIKAKNVRTLCVGIPSGMLEALDNPPYIMGNKKSSETSYAQNLVQITIYKRDLEYGDLIFKPRTFVFDTSLFILPGAFRGIQSNYYADYIARNRVWYSQCEARGIVRRSTGAQIMNRDQYGSFNKARTRTMLNNHLTDHALKRYYRLIFGIDLNEEVMMTDDFWNDLKISPMARVSLLYSELDKESASYITTGDIPFNQLTKFEKKDGMAGYNIADVNDLKEALLPSINDTVVPDDDDNEIDGPEIEPEELDNFRTVCRSVLLNPDHTAGRILTPKLFDRIFMIPVDPDDFAIDVEATRSTDAGKQSFDTKAMAEITETFIDDEGNEAMRLKPRNSGENNSSFNEFFVALSTIGEGSVE